MLKLQGKHFIGFGHWMFRWDPKSQGKEKPLMNGVYHNEMLVYSSEHNQYNKSDSL